MACPSQDPGSIRSSRTGAGAALVPTDAVQVLVCRYDGPFGAPRAHIANRFRLVARRLIVDHARVDALAGKLDCIPSGASRGNVCPDREADDRRGVLDSLEALIHATPSRSGPQPIGPAGNATIDGHLLLCGGPAPGRCFVTTLGECAPPDGCSRSDRVVAIDTGGVILAEQRLRFPWPNGRFRLRVPPGQYAVELLADGPRIHDRVLQTKGATARAGHTTTVVFTFDIP